MSLLVYLPRKFDQTHEREQFRNVCKLLKKRYGSREDEMCIFVANYNIGDVEPDGFLIKNDGLAILEFKDYGGTVTAAENGQWKGVSPEGKEYVVKGGSGNKNPYAQARINRNAFKPAFAETGALSEEQLKGISSIILFHQDCVINNNISPGIRWIKVVDEKGLIDCFDDIVTPKMDLEAVDFNNIIIRLALDPEWVQSPYSDLKYLEKNLAPVTPEKDTETENPDPEVETDPVTTPEQEPKKEEEAKVSDVIGDVTENQPVQGGLLRDIRLPDWLDSLLFDKMHAEYEPDWKKFADNLELTAEDQVKYLGTYFPRSYAEVFCIISNMMRNDKVKSAFSRLDTITILDLCSGGGGDLSGAIDAILSSCKLVKRIQIMAVEACESSIYSLKRVVEEFRKQYPNVTIECRCARCRIVDFAELETIGVNEYAPYDIILFGKAGGELIRQGLKDAYYKACEILVDMMNMTGLLFVLDVTTKDTASSSFYPQIMNAQINQFVSDNKKIRTMLPLSCRFYESTCKKPCFMQQNFLVSHRFKMKDLSKVAYRILGHRLFINEMTSAMTPNDKAYVINENAQETSRCSNGSQIVDAYELK